MVPDRLLQFFNRAFDASPDVVASAPGRVNLIGEHTDYNGGEVLPIAIAARTWVALGRSGDEGASIVVSESEDAKGEFDLFYPRKSGKWWDYVSGVGAQLQPGCDPGPLRIAVVSDVPQGAGLSSSAALEVATGSALSEMCGNDLSRSDLVSIAWRAETTFVGVDCGIMDQSASALAERDHALHLWCDSEALEQVPFRQHVLIFDTATPRELRSSQYNERRRECDAALAQLRNTHPELPNLAAAAPEIVESSDLPDLLKRRALHVSRETRRVRAAVESLKATGTVAGTLLYESHESLRDLYECSSPELDWFVDRARVSDGIEGARLTGAGWGGCAIAVGIPEALADAGRRIAGEFESTFQRMPRFWITRAEDGVRLETPEGL